eukprot:403359051
MSSSNYNSNDFDTNRLSSISPQKYQEEIHQIDYSNDLLTQTQDNILSELDETKLDQQFQILQGHQNANHMQKFQSNSSDSNYDCSENPQQLKQKNQKIIRNLSGQARQQINYSQSQNTQRSHGSYYQEHQHNEESETAINQWKDSRLKKLEDFTRDLGRSSSAKRNRRQNIQVPGSEMTTIKNSSSSGIKIHNQKVNPQIEDQYITLTSKSIENQAQTPQYLNANLIGSASTPGNYSSMQSTQNQDQTLVLIQNAKMTGPKSNQIFQNENNMQNDGRNSLAEEINLLNQQQIVNNLYDDSSDNSLEDDLMLTKTEGSTMLKFGSNVCSTQRSVAAHLNQQNNHNASASVNGEFEKRITDIKQKLTLIKNTINNEIENSFNQGLNQTEQDISGYQTNPYQNELMSPQILSSGGRQRRQNFQINNNLSNHNAYEKVTFQNPLQQNSVVSSLDQFQNKLNNIKQNISSSYNVQHELDALQSTDVYSNFNLPQSTLQMMTDKEKFNRIKNMIDTSFNNTTKTKQTNSNYNMSHSKQLSNNYEEDYLNQQQKLTSIALSLENTQKQQSQNNTLTHIQVGAVTLSNTKQLESDIKNQSQSIYTPLDSAKSTLTHQKNGLLTENDVLKQQIQVQMQTEQLLNARIDQMYQDQQKEKSRYEEQQQKLQEEIGKMCEIMQELNKKKKRSQSGKRGQSKKVRIQQLEKQIRDLQYELSNYPHLKAFDSQIQPSKPLDSLQNVTLENQSKNKQQNETKSTVKTQSKNIEDEYVNSKHLEMPQQKPSLDRSQLEIQVNYLEEKMKKFHDNMLDNNQSQSLREQLCQQIEENQVLRNNYHTSYQEMMNSFEQLKQEMDKRLAEQQYEFENEQSKIRVQFQDELDRKDKVIEELQQENIFLKEKINTVKNVFDIKQNKKSQKGNSNQQIILTDSHMTSLSNQLNNTNSAGKSYHLTNHSGEIVNLKLTGEQSNMKQFISSHSSLPQTTMETCVYSNHQTVNSSNKENYNMPQQIQQILVKDQSKKKLMQKSSGNGIVKKKKKSKNLQPQIGIEQNQERLQNDQHLSKAQLNYGLISKPQSQTTAVKRGSSASIRVNNINRV